MAIILWCWTWNKISYVLSRKNYTQ
jgi:hypothetical protein